MKKQRGAIKTEIIRCKDCKHLLFDTDYCKKSHRGYCEFDNTIKTKNHFCGYAEKRGGNKMNDNDVIKALESCAIKHEHCTSCPFEFTDKDCDNLMSYAYDLIGRQKVKIKELKAERDKLKLEMSYMVNPNLIGDRHEMGCW